MLRKITEMANHCYNRLEISGEPDDIQRLQECLRVNPPGACAEWDLDRIIPRETDHPREACEKWGTRWFSDLDFCNHGDSATCVFDTAWSPSLPVTLAISERFHLRVAHYYEEPGFDFEGDFVAEDNLVIRDEQRDYRPVCAGCQTKHDRNTMIFDEEQGEHYCRACKKNVPACEKGRGDE